MGNDVEEDEDEEEGLLDATESIDGEAAEGGEGAAKTFGAIGASSRSETGPGPFVVSKATGLPSPLTPSLLELDSGIWAEDAGANSAQRDK